MLVGDTQACALAEGVQDACRTSCGTRQAAFRIHKPPRVSPACPICLHLLPAAKQRPWGKRSGRMFFRGAATGERNLTDPDLAAEYPDLLDIQVLHSAAVRVLHFVLQRCC